VLGSRSAVLSSQLSDCDVRWRSLRNSFSTSALAIMDVSNLTNLGTHTNDISIGSVAPMRLAAADCQHLACERRGAGPWTIETVPRHIFDLASGLTSTTSHLEAAGRPRTLGHGQSHRSYCAHEIAGLPRNPGMRQMRLHSCASPDSLAWSWRCM